VFEGSEVFKSNYSATDKVVVNQGGSSSGKTYSILQVLFLRAIEHPRSVTTIVGETIPNLKSGALRDAQTIVANSPILTKLIASYNATDRVYTLYNGSVLEFKSYETSQSAKSGKRQFLFVNEANGISYEIWNELYLRTTIQAFIDYNPNSEFWVHEKLIGKEGVKLFISDHRHNPYVLPAIREKIEALKEIDLELWKVYARGRTGRIEGLVFRNWDVCDSIDKVRCKLVALGMDWGFTNDPTALCAVWKDGDHLYIEELLYERGLTNQDIGARLKDMAIGRTMEIIADSAEPKSIEEVHRMGFNIHGANKGKDSIQNSIDILKRYKLHVLRGSVNLIKELNSYKWKQDKNGNPLNEPVDFNNHLCDSLRYVALNKLKVANSGKYFILQA
jgi:phage terminase large subunit